MKALGRVLRLSLFPSAIADAIGGVTFGALAFQASSPAVWLQLGASLCVYHGGMALNDWADRDEDRLTRPERPIPSGAVSSGVVLALALCLFLGGIVLAWFAHPEAGLVMSGVVILAASYDLVGRGPIRGPLLLAACRMGNLSAAILLGARLVERDLSVWLFAPAVVYGAYVFLVSLLGRMEDAEDDRELGRRPARLLVIAGLCFFGVYLFGQASEWPGRLAQLALAVFTVVTLWRTADLGAEWTRPRVMRSMGLALRRLLVVPVMLALAAPSPTGFMVALVLVCGWPLSSWLRKQFPPS